MKTIRWLGRKASGFVRWVAKMLRAPLRPIVRPMWKLATVPARLLAAIFVRTRPPETRRGFGFWSLVGTVTVATAVGLIVAVLISPVAGIVALLTVGIWAAVRRVRARGNDERQDRRADDRRRGRTDDRQRGRAHDRQRGSTAPVTDPSPA